MSSAAVVIGVLRAKSKIFLYFKFHRKCFSISHFIKINFYSLKYLCIYQIYFYQVHCLSKIIFFFISYFIHTILHFGFHTEQNIRNPGTSERLAKSNKITLNHCSNIEFTKKNDLFKKINKA